MFWNQNTTGLIEQITFNFEGSSEYSEYLNEQTTHS